MSDSNFSHSEIRLLFSLRSHCYSAKMNFRNMNREDLTCSFKCNENETQLHFFENCQPLKTNVKLNDIYGTASQ